MFEILTIIGAGLLGGSVGLAAKKAGVARHVIGVARKPATLKAAIKIGAIDEGTSNAVDAASRAEAIVFCTPVETIPGLIAELLPHLKPEAFLTDVGSTKQTLVAEVEKLLKRKKSPALFVGSHPLAGKEKSGPEHAAADLFQGRAVILTPTKQTPPRALELAKKFWKKLGAKIHEFSPAEHDDACAAISHVPHVLASALAAATPEEFLPLVAGGWIDTTRVAAGDPEMWRQILTQNRRHVLKRLDRFGKVLQSLRQALVVENDAELLRILAEGKRTRDALGS